MILLDALHINNGGGKILLDYLITALEQTDHKFYYLLDSRIKTNEYSFKNSNKVEYMEASYSTRRNFYKQNLNTFKSVFCFGNLPPNIKLNVDVYTYFHQPMFLKIPSDFSTKNKFLFYIKRNILRYLKNNTDYWLVQNETIKEGLAAKFSILPENVMVIPFYPPFEEVKTKPIRENSTYLYVSGAASHKNHLRLIEAFCNFYDKRKVGKLILTVGPEFGLINHEIEQKNMNGYPIENVGFITRHKLHQLYLKSEYCIFPSLAESFGLGLIEAIENGCKIIGADLPYLYEVCTPSLTFDPFSVESIENALEESIDRCLPESTASIENKINDLLKLLK